MGVDMARVEDGIYIVPIYIGIGRQGKEAVWDIWVAGHGVYTAHYFQGLLTITPQVPPGLLDRLGEHLHRIMTYMNPSYEGSLDLSTVTLRPKGDPFPEA